MALMLSIASLAGCSSAYQQIPSDNHGQRVKSLVLHFTTVDYAESLHALTAPGGLSAHYLVTRSNDDSAPHTDATVIQLVDESDRAWHAGESYWQHRSRLNDHSIGIEIVYSPHCRTLNQPTYDEQLCQFPDYDPAQISQLISLIKDILARHRDISPTAIVGHSDIAFNRKMDPGPRFPWHQLYQAGIGAWYNQDTMTALWTRFRQSPLPLTLLQQALFDYGYQIAITGQPDEITRNALAAFQMHFVPWQVSASPDVATAAAIMALLKKYMPEKFASVMQRYEQHATAPVAANTLPAGLLDTTISQPAHFVLSRWQAANQLQLKAGQDAKVSLRLNQQTVLSHVLSPGQTVTVPLSLSSPLALLSIDTTSPVQISLPYSTVTPIKNADRDSTGDYRDPAVIRGQYYGDVNAGVPAALQNTLALLHALSRADMDLQTPVQRLLPYFKGNGRSKCTIADLLSRHCSGYGRPPLTTTEGASGRVSHTPAMWQQVVPADVLAGQKPDIETAKTGAQAPVTALLGQLVRALTGQSPAVTLDTAYGKVAPTLPVVLQTLSNQGGYGATLLYTPVLARQLSLIAPVPPTVSQLAGPDSFWLAISSGGVLVDPAAGLATWLSDDKPDDKPDDLYLQKIYRN
ncbi:N-acetylmuramoyl-L-alanine amidase [Salinimonas lutimaris]|uniref:N-acetylmuramoyl-L-alanine amidase n=1 Tax=Salinimonas lutimaris TaxID=914153 RepID=UPI0010C01D49|nr:N-acetylmuramoyl-L-alanine amidase [Salinimonas lutimaris]